MLAIHKHYTRVSQELQPTDERPVLPVPQPRRGAGQQGAPADPAGGGLRAGHPAGHADRGHRERGRQGHPADPGRVGAPADPGAAHRGRLAVPGDHPPDHRLREGRAPRLAARRGHRVRSRIRRRPLVGEPAAQPERAADQGPAAVRAGRDGHQRAVAAALQPGPRPRAAGPRPEPGAGPRPAHPLRRASRRAWPERARPAGRARWTTIWSRATGSRSPSARRRTAGTAWPGWTARTAGWSSSGTRCPASG